MGASLLAHATSAEDKLFILCRVQPSLREANVWAQFLFTSWQYLLFATRVARDLLLQVLPIKFHLIPDTPKTSATFSVKKATICAEFFGTFYRHRKYIKNITKLRECQIISTDNYRAKQIIHRILHQYNKRESFIRAHTQNLLSLAKSASRLLLMKSSLMPLRWATIFNKK